MGKTYRRDKDHWEDDPVRFENRTSWKKKKKAFKEKRSQRLDNDKNSFEEDSSYHR